MRLSTKFVLSLFVGASILTLTACDNQETKTTEKSTALPAPTPKAMNDKAESEVKKDESVAATVSVETKLEAQAQAQAQAQTNDKTDNIKVEIKETEPAQVVEKDNVSVATQVITKPVKKAKSTAQSRYLNEQKAMLKVLESQYKQVRCTPEAEKLGDNSFCRQEERRLFLEIERVKDEIRLNQ
ncbi:hypothetical protein [Rodentibacter caecimuris]|uniref:hypothetical protein n=1 Tax=Rodentibacter caecimuris TaxID=1796644 RepID=UPI00211A22A0|nr:hypothetical protein [Rodentibacter heylii]MCQ9122438.1 hypothetical protein [Rodentibacter heylii]